MLGQTAGSGSDGGQEPIGRISQDDLRIAFVGSNEPPDIPRHFNSGWASPYEKDVRSSVLDLLYDRVTDSLQLIDRLYRKCQALSPWYEM